VPQPSTEEAGGAPLLRTVGITKRFGTLVANSEISLSVRPGEIHGLLGENGAGKTTLMNIVYGLIQPDEGHIELAGQRVSIKSPRDALALGIGMVHQHFMLVPDMTIAENVALGLGGRPLARSRISEVTARIRALSVEYGLELDPGDVVMDTAVGVRQRVEILKLLYRGAELLIMDEPTAALTTPEWEHLAEVLRVLVASGKSVIFITHKLDELFGVAKRCTVLRDGRVVGESPMAETTKEQLAHQMVGRSVSLRVEHTRRTPGEVVLRTSGLSLVEPDGRSRLREVELELREREILGIAGVDGNGQRELVEVLTGMREPTEGEIEIGGQRFSKLSPQQFKAASGAVVPEDRHHTGSVLSMSVADNLILKDFAAAPFARRGVMNRGAIAAHAERLVADYDIRCASVHTSMAMLSGGNQQKAVLAREFSHQPRVLIAAQPTRGLDVGAIETVYRRLLEYRDAGGAILLLSIELDEILSLADRIAVIVQGRLLRTLDVDEADAQRLGLLMAGEDVPEAVRAG
jgi:general nucleoside transport system ATP-binding protein